MNKLLIVSILIFLSLTFFIKSVNAQDTIPPAAITDLKAYRTFYSEPDRLILEWTAPGDDANTGKATEYDIRFSTSPITENNWDTAIQLTGEPIPSLAGTKENFTVTGLMNNTIYYFAIKTKDDSNNWSELSNVADKSTLPAIIAKSGSAEDIQAAVDAVSSTGGVVYIPEGNFTFKINYSIIRINNGYAGVQIPGGVSIIGAGNNKTILFCPLSCWNYSLAKSQAFFILDGINDKPIRISGITFQGSVNLSVGADDDRYLSGIKAYGVKNYRIDNNVFIDFLQSAISVSGNYVHKWNHGVIDHNIFDNPYKDIFWNYTGNKPYWAYGIIVGGDYPNYPDMDYYLGNYHNNTAFIEDNSFSRHRHSVAMSSSGGWAVVRHNNFTTMILSHYGSYVDAHGGARGYEVYDNIINNSPTDYRSVGDQTQYYGRYMGLGVNPRGGSGVIFNNTFINFDVGSAIKLSNDQSDPTYRLNGFWIWGNAFVNVTTQLATSPGNFNITEGVEYFLYEKPCYKAYPYPHPLTLEDLPENFNFTVEPKKVSIRGNLKDKNNNPVNAEVIIYQKGTNNIIIKNQTDSQGNYNLLINCGSYDLQFNLTNFFIQNFFIKLFSLNTFSNLNNIITYIVSINNKNVLFTVEVTDSQLIQTYSPSKPKRILINGTPTPEVNSLNELKNNTWFYNETEKKLYMLVSEPRCSDETPYRECSTTKPLYCEDGKLIEKCSLCSCPSGYTCNSTTEKCDPLPPGYGLIGFWKLDEGSGDIVYDSSIHGNDGTVYGATWTTNCHSNSCLSFDGMDDYVEVPDSNSLDITQNLTIEAWVYIKNCSERGVIVEKYQAGGQKSYLLYTIPNRISFTVAHSSDDTNFTSVNSITTCDSLLNKWTHIAAVFNQTHKLLYVNGSFDSIATNTYDVINSGNAPLRVGGIYGDWFFNGTIDEIRIYNRTLNEEEIRAHVL
jgi:hypothetical protein